MNNRHVYSTVPWTTKVDQDLRIKSLRDDVVKRRRRRKGRKRRRRGRRRGGGGGRSMLEAEVLCTPTKPYIKMHTDPPSSSPAAVS